ncbi:MAG: 6-phosphogluconolactonase [Gammaproteobacteria bacterium]|nr:6-phosphogluconolactonase [Gammaproteobacteria bacterium]
MSEFKVYADPEAVAQAAADYLFQQIKTCVTEKGRCHVVLPGGSTPARCLELLADKPLPWKNIHWYPGDERCYPVGHAERNDTMIREKLFSQQPLSPQKGVSENFHPIPAELGPERGAEAYTALLDMTGDIDIVVLGMGEDGHTASLFPGNAALEDLRSAVPVYNAPKPPLERISIGLNTLKNAGKCIVIATGENKREAIEKLKKGTVLPVGLVEADVWFVDEDAINVTVN